MSYSYFNAELTCLACGKADTDSVITKVEAEGGTGHWVGTPLDVTVVDMQFSHDTIRLPVAEEPLRILEEWDCTNCRKRQWVEVVVDAGVVRSIEVVPFDIATLDRVHFVTNLVVEFYEDTTGEPFYVDHKIRPDWQARLRPYLH